MESVAQTQFTRVAGPATCEERTFQRRLLEEPDFARWLKYAVSRPEQTGDDLKRCRHPVVFRADLHHLRPCINRCHDLSNGLQSLRRLGRLNPAIAFDRAPMATLAATAFSWSARRQVAHRRSGLINWFVRIRFPYLHFKTAFRPYRAPWAALNAPIDSAATSIATAASAAVSR